MIFIRRFLYIGLVIMLSICFLTSAFAQSETRSELLKEIDSINRKLSIKEKELLAISHEDRAPYGEFLKQPNTGIVLLFPIGLFGDLLKESDGGASYSFVRSAYGPQNGGPDLILAPDKTIVPGSSPIGDYKFSVATVGFIVSLGDLPIEKVTLDHQGIKFLASYKPQTSITGVRAMIQFANEGIFENGYDYKREVRAILNNTYALRSIKNGRSDVLVTFRVVREDSDGSLMILWKRLKRFPIPAQVNRRPK